MIRIIKPIAPYVLLGALLVLTLCTREQQPTAEELEHIETVDSLATQLEEQVETVSSQADENEQAIDSLLQDI